MLIPASAKQTRGTQAVMALSSVRVPRPAASSFTSLRGAPCRPASASLVGAQGTESSRYGGAGCRGPWGGWYSEVKGEPAGRKTRTEPFAPRPTAYTNPSAQSLRLTPRASSFFAYASLRFIALAAVSVAAWTALGPLSAAALINPDLWAASACARLKVAMSSAWAWVGFTGTPISDVAFFCALSHPAPRKAGGRHWSSSDCPYSLTLTRSNAVLNSRFAACEASTFCTARSNGEPGLMLVGRSFFTGFTVGYVP